MVLDLNKSVKVHLEKNESLPLTGGQVGTVTRTRLALGWDEATSNRKGLFGSFAKAVGGSIDLDASIIGLDAAGTPVYTVFFNAKNSSDGAIRHSGDNLTGAGEGDDEVIEIDLARVSPNVKHLVCVITSYKGQTFDQVQNVFCRLDDISGAQPVSVVKYDQTEQPRSQGMIMSVISRTPAGGWQITAKGLPIQEARTAKDQSVVAAARSAV